MKRVLGIIPARGGSKGIPGKNIKNLHGKPLIAYTIELLQKCRLIDDFVVSTDSHEIAEVAREFGAKVLERPEEHAQDLSPMPDVVRHVAEELDDYDYYLTVYPTTPLRIPEDVDGAIKKLLDSKSDSLVAITSVTVHPYGGYSVDGEDLVVNIEDTRTYRRQDMKMLYQAIGGPYIVKREALDELGNNMYTSKKTYFVVPNIRAIDIDEEMDFLFTEFIIEKGLNK